MQDKRIVKNIEKTKIINAAIKMTRCGTVFSISEPTGVINFASSLFLK